MPLSMTGFGEAHCQRDGLAVSVEVRTINSRYFKLTMRISEGYGALEPQIEAARAQAGPPRDVQVTVRVDRTQLGRRLPDQRRGAPELSAADRGPEPRMGRRGSGSRWSSLLAAARAWSTRVGASRTSAEGDWPLIGETLEAAIENMDRMRLEEGRAMAADLRANCRRGGRVSDGDRAPGPAGGRGVPRAAGGSRWARSWRSSR